MNYMESKNYKSSGADIKLSIPSVLENVMKKHQKNIEALVKVDFSGRIDFSAENRFKITQIEDIRNIEQNQIKINISESLLENVCKKVCLTGNQKNLLRNNILNLENAYIRSAREFNQKYSLVKDLGRSTKKALLGVFDEEI